MPSATCCNRSARSRMGCAERSRGDCPAGSACFSKRWHDVPLASARFFVSVRREMSGSMGGMDAATADREGGSDEVSGLLAYLEKVPLAALALGISSGFL